MKSKTRNEYERRLRDLEWERENQRRRAVRAEALVDDGHPFAVVVLQGDHYNVYEKSRDLDFSPWDATSGSRIYGKHWPVLLATFQNVEEATAYASTRTPSGVSETGSDS